MDINRKNEEINDVPIWHKITLTKEEAVAYSGIGKNTLNELMHRPGCTFALRIGRRALIKRKEFEQYISETDEIRD